LSFPILAGAEETDGWPKGQLKGLGSFAQHIGNAPACLCCEKEESVRDGVE